MSARPRWGGRPAQRARQWLILSGNADVCWICNQRIDAWRRHPDPLALEADHVVPRHLGGTDASSNIAAAHAICNRRRRRSIANARRPVEPAQTPTKGRGGKTR